MNEPTLTDTERDALANASWKGGRAGWEAEIERIVAARVAGAVERERAAWVPRVEALADYLTRKVGEAKPPIGTRVAVRSFKGSVGTVVGPDGYPRGEALAVRMDAPYPSGFDDGYACVSADECTVIALLAADDTEGKP